MCGALSSGHEPEWGRSGVTRTFLGPGRWGMRRGLIFPPHLPNKLSEHPCELAGKSFFQPLPKTVNSTSLTVKTGVARHCRALWSAPTCSSDAPEKLVLLITEDHEHAELEILLTEVFLVYIKEVEKTKEGRGKLPDLTLGTDFLFLRRPCTHPGENPRPAPPPAGVVPEDLSRTFTRSACSAPPGPGRPPPDQDR